MPGGSSGTCLHARCTRASVTTGGDSRKRRQCARASTAIRCSALTEPYRISVPALTVALHDAVAVMFCGGSGKEMLSGALFGKEMRTSSSIVMRVCSKTVSSVLARSAARKGRCRRTARFRSRHGGRARRPPIAKAAPRVGDAACRYRLWSAPCYLRRRFFFLEDDEATCCCACSCSARRFLVSLPACTRATTSRKNVSA